MGATSRTSSARTGYQVRALERALDILDRFSLVQPELSLTDIADQTRLPKSTVVRLLSVLEERGYVERSPDTDRYRVGIHAFEVGSIYMHTTTIDAEARPSLSRLAQETNLTANLGVLHQGEVVHIAVVAPDRPIRFYVQVGQRDKVHCTGLGKVLATALSDDELSEVIAHHGLEQRTQRTIVTPDALRLHIAQVREQGFALDDEESFVGLRCVAAPIRDYNNDVAAAISISGPVAEFREETLPGYIDAVKRAALEISNRLGYRVNALDGQASPTHAPG